METYTITLNERDSERLQAVAEAIGMTPEDLIVGMLQSGCKLSLIHI